MPKAGLLTLELQAGETVQNAALRLEQGWSPQWLFDAGHCAIDSAGVTLGAHDTAAVAGPITWNPPIRLPRVEDNINNESTVDAQKGRLAGEVALAALWRHAAVAASIGADGKPDIRPKGDLNGDLNGDTRGARFKNALLYTLRLSLPSQWQIEAELPLQKIYGLHLRRDVGTRSSDIVVFDERKRLIAVISSKWTGRSDRGTEAAQMVPLRRYRPDVPYVMVTSEVPRLRDIAMESAEDRVYCVCPEWAAAAVALRELSNPAEGPSRFPSLTDLIDESHRLNQILQLNDVSDLIDDLRNSGRLG